MEKRNRIRTAMNAAAAGLACLLGTAATTEAAFTIGGQVTNTGNSPLANIPIQIDDALGDVVSTTSTDASGNYSVTVPVGAYTVRELGGPAFQQVGPTFNASAPTAQPTLPNGQWNYGNQANWITTPPPAPFESPINLTGPTTDLSKVLNINYASSSAPTNIQNTGEQIKVNFPASNTNSVTAGGTTYALQQFHFHVPAENTINGVANDIELHFVNASASGGETVVAVFLQNTGVHNAALDPVLTALANLSTAANATAAIGSVNLSALLPASTQGYYYYGSLTTPPLSVGVNWFLFSTPISMDATQYNAFKSFEQAAGFYPNARATQSLDGRSLNEVDYNVNLTAANPSFTAANFQLAPVPEPSSWVLLGLGAAGLGTRFARRRSAA